MREKESSVNRPFRVGVSYCMVPLIREKVRGKKIKKKKYD